MEGSIIRRGNHFIHLECGWVLIDGPWFRYLEDCNYPYVRTVSLESSSTPCAVDTPGEATCTLLDWERVLWHPGYSPRLYSTLGWKWKDYQSSRFRYGWRTMPNGKLPAYVNRIEFPVNHVLQWELEALEPK